MENCIFAANKSLSTNILNQKTKAYEENFYSYCNGPDGCKC